MITQPVIDLQHVSKRYSPEVLAVDDVSLQVQPGQLLALLGPSGCGKSTTLRLIAGLETPNTGSVYLGGACVAGNGAWLPPESRRVGLVFQDYALFPHMTVARNVAFPLTNGYNRRQRRERVAEMLALVGLPDLGGRYPHQLSGGQQQRVALARALAPQPAVVLLDEPFSNLDASLRRTMRAEVRQILQATHATTIFVTHDQEEAFSIADQVVVMQAGVIQQMGPPREVYLQPATLDLATFLGEANILPGRADGERVECVLGSLPLRQPTDGAVQVMLRPESMALMPSHTGVGCIESLSFFGPHQVAYVRWSDGSLLQAHVAPHISLTPGDRVDLTVAGPVMAYPVQ